MVTQEEKEKLVAIASNYKEYESQLENIEKAQEFLKEKFHNILKMIESTKANELELLETLEKKYKKKFTVNELIEIVHG
jgi:CRISPR/Cas system-associated endonuclease Cas1